MKSINPATEETLQEFNKHTAQEIEVTLCEAQNAYLSWQKVKLEDRAKLVSSLGRLLKNRKEECAKIITIEMGKPYVQSEAELEKCAWLCDYYAEHAEIFLADKTIKTDNEKSYIKVAAVSAW